MPLHFLPTPFTKKKMEKKRKEKEHNEDSERRQRTRISRLLSKAFVFLLLPVFQYKDHAEQNYRQIKGELFVTQQTERKKGKRHSWMKYESNLTVRSLVYSYSSRYSSSYSCSETSISFFFHFQDHLCNWRKEKIRRDTLPPLTW